MSYTRPGRLYRTLAKIGVPTPLITVEGDTFTASDDTIQSISIRHGGTDPSPGIEPAEAAVTARNAYWIKTGESFRIALTDAAALELYRHTGSSTVSSIRERFNGRAGSQRNTDDRGQLIAHLTAASWSAHLRRIRTPYYLAADMAVTTAIRHLVTSDSIPQITYANFGTSDVLAASIADATYGDTIDSLTADIGMLVRNTRDGVLEAWALPYRQWWAEQRLADRHPLIRSQVLNPAEWEQPNSDMPAKIRADWIASDGTVRSRSAGGDENSIVERYDWQHVKAQTNALDMRFEALHAQNWGRRFHLPSVTVDLLRLLGSDRAYDREQAGMLLRMNAGDPIGLSGDWQPSIRGIHFVTGIVEQITSNSWTLTLSLVPHVMVTGAQSPTVPAIVWDSATYPWDDETRVWDH